MNSLDIITLVSGTITAGLVGATACMLYKIIKSDSPSLSTYNETTGQYESVWTFKDTINGIEGPLMVWDKGVRKYLPRVEVKT